jgi:protein-disulfide isomerase
MKEQKRYLLAGGFLLLILLLASCQQVVDDPAAPVSGPAAVEAAPLVEATEENKASVEADQSSEVGENGYQGKPALNVAAGFTEQGEPFKGDPAASVVIEEFSSYQCPFCARYVEESYPQVVADYVETGKVLYIFRDFPLPNQPQSSLAAEAANCAGQVEEGSAYWAMHDRIFQRQSEWSGKGDADAVFKRYAQELELDTTAFDECLGSGATRTQIMADTTEGNSRGVTGTPTFFINGQPLVGAQPYAIIAEAIDAALAGESPPVAGPVAPAPAPTPAAIIPTDDARVLGDSDAPVTIVEFSDYQCPYCARHVEETWPKLKAEFIETGRVQYAFKDFPLDNIHPQAFKAHEAARCAGEQGAYWTMHDRLFAGQPEWNGRADHVTVFRGYAAELGLQTADFDACLDSGRWASAVNANLAEGASLGVQGTPTFFINGYPLVGVAPYETFQYAIELAEQGKLGEAYQPNNP